jgi:hypothetical protein
MGFGISLVLFHFSVHRNGHILSGCNIPELHDAMPFPRKVPPSAGLVWVLLNRLIWLASHIEACSLQALIAGASDGDIFPLHHKFSVTHHLLGNGLHQLKIEHISHLTSELKGKNTPIGLRKPRK